MNLTRVAWKNLKHKRVRTALTVCGVAIAVAVLVSLLGFRTGYTEALHGDIDRMGYQLLVTAKGCPYEAATLMLKGGGGMRYMDETVHRKIAQDERVAMLTPQLVATAFDDTRDEGRGGMAMYMGVVDSYLELKPWVDFRAGGWFSSDEADEAILGYEAAELEQRLVGDKLFVPGRNVVLTVTGIFERTGTQDDGIIFMPLKTVQRIFDLDEQITGIGIRLHEIGRIAEFEEDLYNEPGIQVVSMAQVKGTILNLVGSAELMTTAIAVVAVLIAVIGVMNTILMSVFERTREIGVMKALGASRAEVFRIIWLETAFICLIGGVAGNLAALAGGRLVEHLLKTFLPYAPSGQLVRLSPSLLLLSLLGAAATGLLAGIYPAARAAAMHPVRAIRVAS
jgi:putative ABC transport system permease protein